MSPVYKVQNRETLNRVGAKQAIERLYSPKTGGECKMSAEYNDHEEVHIIEADDVGDEFRKVTRTTRQENGEEPVEFVSLKKGRLQEMNTPEGDTVVVESIQSSSSLGSTEYINELVDALDQLDQELNGD